MVSFTITEKGYALRGADGQYYRFIQDDIDYSLTGQQGLLRS